MELKSGLEELIYNYLKENLIDFKYESLFLYYFRNQRKFTYKPDFIIKNTFIIETKGAFNSSDRRKMKLVKEENPNLDIRFIFSDSTKKIGKKSNTDYAKWCKLFNFKFHCLKTSKYIFPIEWLNEIKQKQRSNNEVEGNHYMYGIN